MVVSEAINELLLIDGQQRMTSISLLLLAIHKNLVSGKIQSSNPTLAKEILKDYLINEHKPDTPEYIRLKQVNQDSRAYSNLFYDKGTAGYDEITELVDSKILENYTFF